MTNQRAQIILLTFVILAMSPLLINPPQAQDQEPTYIALNPRWEYAGVVTGESLGPLIGAVALPGRIPFENRLVAVDSTGRGIELQFVNGSWVSIDDFHVGHPVHLICPAAPQHDRRWRVYVGSADGRVTELSRSDTGWIAQPVIALDHPIIAILASNPGKVGVSQLFVIDASGHVTNLWIGMDQSWVPRPVPDIRGGATDVTFDIGRSGLQILVAGGGGELHRFVQDTMGYWSGELWASMPSGVRDMAASADPTMKDLAVYFSGQDGHFRYLFYDHKTDEASRIPAAAGASFLIGKQNSLRYNEFFALSEGEYCQFEFNNGTREWDRIPLHRVGDNVVSVDFGQARPVQEYQFYVATGDGFVHEFVRQPMPVEDLTDE